MDNIQIIQECYTRVTLIPVIGSGLSIPFGLPDWRTLIEEAAAHFNVPTDKERKIKELLDSYEFVDAIDVILEVGVDELSLQEFVSEYLLAAKAKASMPKNNYSDLAELSKIRFITTNYDRYINDIVGVNTFRLEELESIPINQFSYSLYDHSVIPIHGEINRPDSIVFSRESYNRLYDTAEFNEQFQHLRSHYTFLFIGFSFEDEYIQKLFDKVVQRFEAQHFILFEKSIREKDPDKIEWLKSKYGIESIFYDASIDGHTEAISKWLHDIFDLKDPEVDYDAIEKLPEKNEEKMTSDEKRIIDEGTSLIRQENLEELYKLYNNEFNNEQFYDRTNLFKLNVICGLLWYYGFQRKDKECEALLETVLEHPAIKENKNRLAIMQGQLYWNTRDFDKAIDVLESYDGARKGLVALLLDIVKVYNEFLPNRSECEGIIPVYNKQKSNTKESINLREKYVALRDKYINTETYNLRGLEEYEDRDSEQIAYYWLGVVAGQLFHEHEDAIKYLLRSCELRSLMVVHEELAHNYFSLAEAGVRYEENPKKYQLNVNYLFKAKIHFQYIFNFSDETAVSSMVKKSGFAYLQTLYWLKDFISFNEFVKRNGEDLPDVPELWLLRAQAAVEYEHTVSDELREHLTDENRKFIDYCCIMYRADYFSLVNPHESERLRAVIIERSKADYPITDRRILQIVIDTVFFLKDIAYYEELKSQYQGEFFEDFIALGLEDELYGRIDVAEQRIIKAFDEHKDYDGTFRILRGFYIRNHKKKDFDKLYEEVMLDPPNEQYKQPEFYAEYIISELRDWNGKWRALQLYAKYHDMFNGSILHQKELEETLKIQIADYSDYVDRIEWNRYMLTKAPRFAKISIYDTILKLYVANNRYKEASNVIDEMKKLNIPVVGGFDDLINVCLRKQKKKCYCKGNYVPYYRTDSEGFNRIQQKAIYNFRYNEKSFRAVGKDVILSVELLLCIFRQNRQKELSNIAHVHIMYAGLINLQNSLWGGENPFLRMVLQWIECSENVVMAAPDFQNFCKLAPLESDRDRRAEEIQIKLYSKEHPDYIKI